MITIERAIENDIDLLSQMGKETFIAAHWHSAPMQDLIQYVDQKYDPGKLSEEFKNPDVIYSIVFRHGQVAGYSRIILNSKTPNEDIDTTQLDRLYLLKDYFQLGIGATLLNYNLELSKSKGQTGMWLNVWSRNHRAIDFYKKHGFETIGETEFKITDTHYNPCTQMLLRYL